MFVKIKNQKISPPPFVHHILLAFCFSSSLPYYPPFFLDLDLYIPINYSPFNFLLVFASSSLIIFSTLGSTTKAINIEVITSMV